MAAEKWNNVRYDLTKVETNEERSERIKSATKRVVIRLIDGVFDIEFDVKDGQIPITPREFKSLIHTLTLRHRQSLRAGSLSQRMIKNAEEKPAVVAAPLAEDPNPVVAEVAGIVVRNDDVLTTFLDRS